MKISTAGLNLIERFEGLRLTAYKDSAGVWTIGYGHTEGVRQGMTCTKAQASAWLTEDVGGAEGAVNDLVSRQLKQAQFDALVSFTFNPGPDAFRGSTLREVVNQGEDALVPRELTRWVNADNIPLMGLASRRVAEAQLYISAE